MLWRGGRGVRERRRRRRIRQRVGGCRKGGEDGMKSAVFFWKTTSSLLCCCFSSRVVYTVRQMSLLCSPTKKRFSKSKLNVLVILETSLPLESNSSHIPPYSFPIKMPHIPPQPPRIFLLQHSTHRHPIYKQTPNAYSPHASQRPASPSPSSSTPPPRKVLTILDMEFT